MNSADYHSVIMHIAPVDTYPLLYEYGIDELLKVTVKGIQDLNVIL